MNIELILLVLSFLFITSIFIGGIGYKYGVPSLLLFLVVGMIFGIDGIGINFDNVYVSNNIGTLALCIILFSGGLDTDIAKIRPVLAQGIMLATIGVLITALTLGILIWWLLGMSAVSASVGFLTALLLASAMSSTDSASVFSILRSSNVNLHNNLRPMLELESGSNDPVAYVLVITLTSIIQTNTAPSLLSVSMQLIMQLAIGSIIGYGLGKLTVLFINKVRIGNFSLYPILVFSCAIFVFSACYFLKGNGYLAVYIAGLVIGNSRIKNKLSILKFHDGVAWLSQVLLFLLLGLLVNPHELVPLVIPGIAISLLITFIARPLSVFITLMPFRKMLNKDKFFVSWVGLRGAVPIIFSISILAADIPHARLIFNIVFLCTLMSLIIQGTTLPFMARLLKVCEKNHDLVTATNFDIDFSKDIKTAITEVTITSEIIEHGDRLMDLKMPEKTLAIMVKRGNDYFVPTGATILSQGDKLLIITDDQKSLIETYERLGIKI